MDGRTRYFPKVMGAAYGLGGGEERSVEREIKRRRLYLEKISPRKAFPFAISGPLNSFWALA